MSVTPELIEKQLTERKARREKAIARRSCVDCPRDTCPPRQPDEWYMIRDALWSAAGMTPDGGCLCIECLENRIGRQLTYTDFTNARVNDPNGSHSVRLRDRLQQAARSTGDGNSLTPKPFMTPTRTP